MIWWLVLLLTGIFGECDAMRCGAIDVTIHVILNCLVKMAEVKMGDNEGRCLNFRYYYHSTEMKSVFFMCYGF